MEHEDNEDNNISSYQDSDSSGSNSYPISLYHSEPSHKEEETVYEPIDMLEINKTS